MTLLRPRNCRKLLSRLSNRNIRSRKVVQLTLIFVFIVWQPWWIIILPLLPWRKYYFLKYGHGNYALKYMNYNTVPSNIDSHDRNKCYMSNIKCSYSITSLLHVVSNRYPPDDYVLTSIFVWYRVLGGFG